MEGAERQGTSLIVQPSLHFSLAFPSTFHRLFLSLACGLQVTSSCSQPLHGGEKEGGVVSNGMVPGWEGEEEAQMCLVFQYFSQMHKTLGHAQTHTYTHTCTRTHTHTIYTHICTTHTYTHTQYTHTHARHTHTHTHDDTHTFKRSRAIIQTCPKPTLCAASKPQEVHTTRIEHTPTQILTCKCACTGHIRVACGYMYMAMFATYMYE